MAVCYQNQAVLYEYQKTRNADAPRRFLSGFDGKMICDGYQVYHALENREGTRFKVAGCWAHARRPFAQVYKGLGEEKAAGTAAAEALIQIQNIYHTDNGLLKLPPSERKKRRKTLVKPLVDTFFEWCRKVSIECRLLQKQQMASNTASIRKKIPEGYSLMIRRYRLITTWQNRQSGRFVLEENWKLIDTVHGAQASAIIYSIVETAKAHDLNIYNYFKHLLTEIPKHMDDTDLSFLDPLLP